MPETPSNLSSVKSRIDSYMLNYCDGEIERATNLHPTYGRLWDAIRRHIEGGGKRLRPYLVVLAYEAFGGTNDDEITRAACAWELLHVAMLMHDDIIDRDYVRHGHPNVAGMYLEHYEGIVNDHNRRHFADSSAIMAGDLLISAAYDLIYGSDFAPEQVRQASIILHEAIFTVVGGELLDVEASAIGLDVSPQTIAEAKTAGYTIIGPLLTGAALAGASDEAKNHLRELGLTLGVGFQYVDDVLGVFGDQAKTGKPVTSDLEEGKRTFVVVEALELMGADERSRAEYLLNHPSKDHAVELHSLISHTNIKEVIAAKISDYHAQSTALIQKLDLAPSSAQAFKDIINLILRRQS